VVGRWLEIFLNHVREHWDQGKLGGPYRDHVAIDECGGAVWAAATGRPFGSFGQIGRELSCREIQRGQGMGQILASSIDGDGGGGSSRILSDLPADLPDHSIRMIACGGDREPWARIPDAVAVHGGHVTSKHHHLKWTTLNMFNRQPQTISYPRIAFTGCQHDLIGLDEHLLATGATQGDFTDLASGGCLDIDTLRPIDSEDSGQMSIREDLKKAPRFDDLLTKSKNRALPVPKERWSGFSIQWDGFDGQPKRGSEQSQP